MKKLLSFLKKYPITITLAIIAINLSSISFNLKENGKILKENGRLLMYKEYCARYYAFYSSGTDKQAEEREKLTASKVDVPVGLVDAFCQRMI